MMLEKNELTEKLGKVIGEIRIEKGLSVQSLGYKVNMEGSNISRLEMGRTNPTIFTLYKIANALDTDLDKIINICLKQPRSEKPAH